MTGQGNDSRIEKSYKIQVETENMKALQEDIKTGNLKHAYLLYGEETYLVKQYRERLVQALSNPEIR